jgi:hypothetical protein
MSLVYSIILKPRALGRFVFVFCMEYFEMSVACVLVWLTHMASSEICSALRISESQKEFSNKKKNKHNVSSLLHSV